MIIAALNSYYLNTDCGWKNKFSQEKQFKRIILKKYPMTWWRNQLETFYALLALCKGNPPVTGGFPSKRPVTVGFDDFCDLRLNKRLTKRSRRRWFQTPSRPLWRHCYENTMSAIHEKHFVSWSFGNCSIIYLNFGGIVNKYCTANPSISK